ncbi:MAG: ArsR family transcriptional regulator [Bacteroidetes bacterium]|nr:ArsR family transcriptional regulator [Bacteroidota bacterium]
MGTTKTENYSENQIAIALKAKALGHPARIAIIDYLMKVNACICGDIVNELPLSQPTVSQHLRELKNAGLIKGSIEGTSICYCIDEKAIGEVLEYFFKIASQLANKNENCC